MSKLSPSLKALINALHARPGPVPAPPSISSIYARIEQEATAHQLSQPTWLSLSTAATLTLNSPASLAILYAHTTRSLSHDNSLQTAEFMREVGLKCISFNGVPRTINTLNAFRSALPESITSQLSTRPTRTPTRDSVPAIAARGRTLWDSIYNPLSTKLISKLSLAHPDLPVHILHNEYGALLCDPPPRTKDTSARVRVGRVSTSVAAVACLRAQQGVGPQVLSHVYGLRKAVEDESWKTDVGVAEGGEEGVRWLASDEGCVWILEKVDELVEALGGGNFAAGKAKL